MSLEETLGVALRDRKLTLATAESCTGGLIAHRLTNVAGSSAYFLGGIVSYSNEAKGRLLGVPLATLVAYGAVSEPVARAMAFGAVRDSRAQLSVAVTGVAGPTGGSADKPVGTVWFGWQLPGRTETECRRFDGDRAAVRAQTVAHALAGLVRRIAAG